MLGLLGKLFDSNEKQLNKLRGAVEKINALEKEIKKLRNGEIKGKTEEFKEKLSKDKTLDDLLPEAFALARETASRTINLRPFDVQLMAAIAFHQGKIAEQKTGEGKTLSAVPALYLNCLTGKGAHLITVNDYLARRDTGWNGPAFHLLGVSVGCIIHDKAFLFDPEYEDKDAQDERLAHLRPVSRKEAYGADIIYGTNNEFGFDYLRDNMVQDLKNCAQRGHHFAIVDEVDFILIDEARTPLIISAPDVEPTDKYFQFAGLVKALNPDMDYIIDEKLKTANLTDHGIKKVEKRLGVTNLYEKDFDTIKHIENALKAQTLYLKDRDYITKENQVVIVDEFTGRLMYGRRWSEGLHQAVEAKEGVKIQQESRTLATISFQNYFRMYKKLAGMTGTAATEAEEFKKIYNLDTLVIPTHKPMIRKNHPDVVYKTQRAKYAAVGGEIEKCFKKEQPVLVGTTSIEKNEIVSELLKRKGIPHQILNAKQHEKEASIIAQAGKLKAVTVATNMAGRGVDIVLGGDPTDREKKAWQKEHDKVIKLGGLHVVGTERHEARRIDNQLRGRAGRQGDPGSSRFFVSLEDDIMRLFGGEKIASLMDTFKMPENVPLEHPMVSRAIQQAQVKVEGFHFDARKHVVEYDDVMNKQREIIYKKRQEILKGKEDATQLKENILGNIKDEISRLVDFYAPEGFAETELKNLIAEFVSIVPFDTASQERIREQLAKYRSNQKIKGFFNKIIEDLYQAREKEVGASLMRQIERFVTLTTIDNLWMDHLDSIDDLREGIRLRGYGQRDPLIEYKQEAFAMFEKLMTSIDEEISRRIFRIRMAPQAQRVALEGAQLGRQDIAADLMRQPQEAAISGEPIVSVAGEQKMVKPVVSGQKKPGRNDPCPCGAINPKTRKPYKYKKCGLINAPYHKG